MGQIRKRKLVVLGTLLVAIGVSIIFAGGAMHLFFDLSVEQSFLYVFTFGGYVVAFVGIVMVLFLLPIAKSERE